MDISLRERARLAVERKTGRPTTPRATSTFPRGRITLGAIWRFGRPHTLIGTTLSIVSVSLCALDDVWDIFQPHIMWPVFVALVTSLMMNIYIVGLNQMTDVAIDKINKPFLPVASGELTVSQGWLLVTSCLVGSFVGGFAFGSFVRQGDWVGCAAANPTHTCGRV